MYKPAASCLTYPALSIRIWLTDSASAGVSFKVAINIFEKRIEFLS